MTPGPLLLFAPGAGAASTSPWMRAWAARLADLGAVAPFDYPYRLAGRKLPDRHDVLVAAHREALARARAADPGRPVVLIGKSMGGRIGCHVAHEEPDVGALVCLGYPLRPVGGGPPRDAVLLALRTPVLFVQGTRDRLCPLDELARVRARMAAPSALHVVEGGDHDLALARRDAAARGVTQAQADAAALAAVAAFLRAHAAR